MARSGRDGEVAGGAAKEAPAGLPQDVADFIVNAASFLRSRDNMNATLHLSDVQLSPLTQTAAGLIDRFKIGPQPAIVEAATQPPAPSGEGLPKPENLNTFRWLCNAVGQVERDLKRAPDKPQPPSETKTCEFEE